MKLLFITALFFCFTATTSFGQVSIPKPFVLGIIETIDSKILGEKRVLNIYLPPQYNQKDSIKYPIIYLLDGGADEDFIHIVGLVQFANFEWVNMLPNTIVVGIANVDRRRDFTFPTTIKKDKIDFPTTGNSSNFIQFIEQELQPFIQNKFNCSNSKTIIGQSFGGLLATEILLKKPTLFNKYIIVSPSLWWDDESLLLTNIKLKNMPKLSVFIAVGNEGKVMITDAKNLYNKLKTNHPKATVIYTFFGNKNHASIMHSAVYAAFEAFNNKGKN